MVLLDDNSLITKSRSLPGSAIAVLHKKRNNKTDPWKVDLNATGEFIPRGGSQITATRGNRFRGSFSGDLGGPFGTTLSRLSYNEHRFTGASKSNEEFLSTIILPPDEDLKQPLTLPQELRYPLDLDALGANAISRVNPVNPIVDASTTFAEAVREGVPVIPGMSFWESRAKALLGISSEFLNAEFGWLPLIDEIKKFSGSVKKSRDVLLQYKRDEGKLVRRRFNFPMSQSTETKESLKREPILLALNGSSYSWTKFVPGNPSGTLYTTDKSVRRSWFSGAFRYYIPDQNDPWSGIMSHGSNADKLFGTSLTPEILWELAPWSWAIDYFSNAQEVITNLQNFEIYGEILAYGYMMDENVQSRNTFWTPDSGSSYSGPCSTVYRVQTRKLRKAANPFGFGLSMSDLSPTQMAILAAAGITVLL